MLKILKNKTSSDLMIKDTGVVLLANSSYYITPQDYWIWTASKDIVNAINLNKVIVNDGDNDLPLRYGVGLIQDNKSVINEYYTLVQDDDVLVGNGEVLYLNDEMWTTDNVPFYNHQQLPEDDTI